MVASKQIVAKMSVQQENKQLLQRCGYIKQASFDMFYRKIYIKQSKFSSSESPSPFPTL